MTVMVISRPDKFSDIARSMDDMGIGSFHFCDSEVADMATAPARAVVPFLDFVVIADDAGEHFHLENIICEAKSRHIPVLSEQCIKRARELCSDQ